MTIPATDWESILAPLATRALDEHPAPEIGAADAPCSHLSITEWVQSGQLAAWQARQREQDTAA